MNSNGISLKTKNYNVTNLKNSFFSGKIVLVLCLKYANQSRIMPLLLAYFSPSMFYLSFFACTPFLCVLRWGGFFQWFKTPLLI